MSILLMRLFSHDIEGSEPKIVDLDRPIQVVGMAMDTNLKRIYRDVPTLGRRYREFKQAHPIVNKKEPWAFAAVSCGYDPAVGTMWYLLGDVVTSLAEVPAELTPYEIPAIKYAVFPVRPRNRFGWGLAIANTKRYAYTVWLPKSPYEPAGVIDDFEYHDERSTRKRDPEIDLYVGIKPKG